MPGALRTTGKPRRLVENLRRLDRGPRSARNDDQVFAGLTVSRLAANRVTEIGPSSLSGGSRARIGDGESCPKQTPSTAEFHQQRGRERAEPPTSLIDVRPGLAHRQPPSFSTRFSTARLAGKRPFDLYGFTLIKHPPSNISSQRGEPRCWQERADPMDRREFTAGIPFGLIAAAMAGLDPTIAVAQTANHQPGAPPPANAPRLQIGALVYPRIILLDLASPLTVFNLMRAEVHLVAKDRTPIHTDVGISITPTATLKQCPGDLDVLFVPGGLEGTVAGMDDPAIVDFLADRGERAKLVTSVCTGSLLLGAAGLLRGYAATSHWYVRDLLGLMGASAKADRVVVDRNRVTGAGVTAGLDFSFELARQLRREEAPRLFELVLEYDPKPPFAAGTPELAGAPLTDRVRQIRGPAIAAAREAAARVAERLRL
jgi:cyclohexyl-isocyanide hydratase